MSNWTALTKPHRHSDDKLVNIKSIADSFKPCQRCGVILIQKSEKYCYLCKQKFQKDQYYF